MKRVVGVVWDVTDAYKDGVFELAQRTRERCENERKTKGEQPGLRFAVRVGTKFYSARR